MQEKDREEAISRKTEGAGADARVLVMTDGEEELGYAVVGIQNGTLLIYGFSVSGRTDFAGEKPDMETVFVLDTLMRAAASFGETNGADKIETTFPDFFGFFKLRGFTVLESHAETPMSTIVRYE